MVIFSSEEEKKETNTAFKYLEPKFYKKKFSLFSSAAVAAVGVINVEYRFDSWLICWWWKSKTEQTD